MEEKNNLNKFQIDLNHPFLNSCVMDYIGSKKEHLPFIDKILNRILKSFKNTKKEIPVFVDLCAGSGVVSRLAKLKGFKVIANDFEPYAQILSRTPIRFYQEQVEDYFKFVCQKLNLNVSQNYYQSVINYLNDLEKVKYNKNNYFSKYYAPANTKNYDKKNERLYFTSENAQKIDAIIELIFNNKIFSKEAREIILFSLLNETINVINNNDKLTRSFYPSLGKGKKELKERVLTSLTLKCFPFLSKKELNERNKQLLTAEFLCEGYKQYAEVFFEKIKQLEANDNLEVDITYLDPPFQQQQYSNNYSILNSICLNDKPEIESIENKKFIQREEGLLSNFCKKSKRRDKKLAQIALNKTFESINSQYILYSYVPNSVLTITEIIEIFSQNGNNHIQIEFEYNNAENLKDNFNYKNNIKHCLLIIEKNKRQLQEDIDFLIRELKAKSVLAENESFKINQKFLNIKRLIKENEDWKILNNTLTNKTKLFHKDKFLFEINENLMILNNIDTDFTEEDKQIIGKYIINEKMAKKLKEEKEEVNIPNYTLSEIKIKEELPTEKLPNYLSQYNQNKKEETKDIQQIREQTEDLFKMLEKKIASVKENQAAIEKIKQMLNEEIFGLNF